MRELLTNRNFVFHWAGAAFFQTGNFFSLVAFPWLILSITGNDPIATTAVMAAISLPHGVFVLFGGAVADRISSIKLLVFSRLVFFLVMCSFALLVCVKFVPLWLIYFYAFLTGTLGAIGFPAVQSMLPDLVARKMLGPANAVVMGTGQLAQVAGPLLAGWTIWFGRMIFEVPTESVAYQGLALAFFVDALTALFALYFAVKINGVSANKGSGKLFSLMTEGFKFCWQDRGIRLVLFYIICISFFLQGPLIASLPIFTKVSLGLSEDAYGSLYAMLGLGTVVGAVLGATKVSIDRKLGLVVLACNFAAGLSFCLLSQSIAFWQASSLLVTFGVCNGIVMIAGTTWFQVRTPADLMGRVMGLLLFCVIGLIPVSATFTGLLIEKLSIASVFLYAGAAALVVSGIGLCTPRIRGMGDVPSAENIELKGRVGARILADKP